MTQGRSGSVFLVQGPLARSALICFQLFLHISLLSRIRHYLGCPVADTNPPMITTIQSPFHRPFFIGWNHGFHSCSHSEPRRYQRLFWQLTIQYVCPDVPTVTALVGTMTALCITRQVLSPSAHRSPIASTHKS
ncbi:hypothetical protein EDB87DRAFT_1129268 [Lactarius vividus]|nr:hypothetical protein EDB87DRAFT_1129268 [Lactarius vividus]